MLTIVTTRSSYLYWSVRRSLYISGAGLPAGAAAAGGGAPSSSGGAEPSSCRGQGYCRRWLWRSSCSDPDEQSSAAAGGVGRRRDHGALQRHLRRRIRQLRRGSPAAAAMLPSPSQNPGPLPHQEHWPQGRVQQLQILLLLHIHQLNKINYLDSHV